MLALQLELNWFPNCGISVLSPNYNNLVGIKYLAGEGRSGHMFSVMDHFNLVCTCRQWLELNQKIFILLLIATDRDSFVRRNNITGSGDINIKCLCTVTQCFND